MLFLFLFFIFAFYFHAFLRGKAWIYSRGTIFLA